MTLTIKTSLLRFLKIVQENKTRPQNWRGIIVGCAKLAPDSNNIREILMFKFHSDLRWLYPFDNFTKDGR